MFRQFPPGPLAGEDCNNCSFGCGGLCQCFGFIGIGFQFFEGLLSLVERSIWSVSRAERSERAPKRSRLSFSICNSSRALRASRSALIALALAAPASAISARRSTSQSCARSIKMSGARAASMASVASRITFQTQANVTVIRLNVFIPRPAAATFCAGVASRSRQADRPFAKLLWRQRRPSPRAR